MVNFDQCDLFYFKTENNFEPKEVSATLIPWFVIKMHPAPYSSPINSKMAH